jgi:outer membrane protein, protease secretion system
MMHKSRLLISGILAVALPIKGFSIDLIQAYNLALANDPAYRSAIKELEAGQANREIGRAGLLPQVSVNYYQAANSAAVSQPYTPTSTQQYASTNSGIQLTQALVNFSALAAYRQGNSLADAAQAKFVHDGQELLIRTLQTYTDLLNSQEQLEFYVAQLRAYKGQLTTNERKYGAGEGTMTEILELRSQAELAEVQILEARSAINLNRRKLEAIIGQEITSEVKGLHKNFRVSPLPNNDLNFWKSSTLALNQEIKVSRLNERVANEELEKNKSLDYPILNVVAGYTNQNSAYTNSINTAAQGWSVGLQATWALTNGGQTTGLINQSSSKYEKSQADTEVVRARVLTELQKQYDLVATSQQKITALQRAVGASEQLALAVRKSVAGGERISADIVLAEKNLVSAKRDLAFAKYNYVTALIKLKQVTGTLTVKDLEDVAANFEREKISGKP